MDRCTCGRMPSVKMKNRRFTVVCPNCQRKGDERLSPYMAELAWKSELAWEEDLEQQNLPTGKPPIREG